MHPPVPNVGSSPSKQPHPPRDPAALLRAAGFAGFLLGLGNGVSLLSEDTHRTFAWPLMALNLAVLAGALWWAVGGGRLRAAEVGLTRAHLAKNAALGIGIGAVLILPVVLYFAFPVGLPGGEVDYEESRRQSTSSFLEFMLLRQPLGTSVFEEVMFRGILQGFALRAFAVAKGIGFVAVVFAAWHVVVNLQTIGATSAAGEGTLTGLAVVASMLTLVIGSVAMSLLRLRTGSIVAPIAFHWIVVVGMQGTLFVASR